jgi:MFS family permease
LTPFRRLLAASAASNVGDGIRLGALPLLAALLTRDPTAIASITAVIWLPWLIFGVLGGAIVDRVNRVRLIVLVQLGRALVIGALAVLVWSGNASMLALYAVAFAIGLAEMLADTTMQTLVPAVVPRDELEHANGRLYASQTVGNEFVGPPAGSVMFAAIPAAPFAVNAVAWVLSAVSFVGLRVEQPARTASVPTSIRQDIVAGARYLFGHSILRALLVWSMFVNGALTAFGSIVVLYALDVLRLEPAAFGLLGVAASVGGITGTLLAGRAVRRFGRSRTVVAASLVTGVAAILAGLVQSAFVFAALDGVLTAAAATVIIVLTSLRQSIVPPHMLGRVVATTRTFGYGAIPLGAIAGGWLAATLGLSAPFIAGGAVVLAATAIIVRYLSPAAIDAARAEAGLA